MLPIIEFCMSNLASGAHDAMEELEKDPSLDIIEYDCLGNCSQCAMSMYALVNGEVVQGEDADQLVSNVYQHLEDNPMF
ncbi:MULTISPECIES: YuzB family protein [Salibacterium]|uniref:Uncharacterized protein YuzB, UPF0349 family n=2 Tax=Salibacterium TaxID=1884429 RepID=A0A1I4M004_9BACI|nr:MULTISPECIES: YuzB family protein [Salibacterium]SFL96356.1 Uncharacterized protein YuzB, UPF0349 family [Salibacterium qingdaonense]SFP51280.1 Uncharacterized protein YuzB, UPF0349 family [Salibacterium halotolerans]